MINIWLDDRRFPRPGIQWIWVKTAADAIYVLDLHRGDIGCVSLDHDIGDETLNGNGYQVACWLEEEAHFGKPVPQEIHIHSDNSVGIGKMRAALSKIPTFRR